MDLYPGLIIKRQLLVGLTPADQRPHPGEHWDCKCLDCGGVAPKKKGHLKDLAERASGTGCKCTQGNNNKPPSRDHTGEEVGGKKVTGFAGREPSTESKVGKPLWHWECLSCGRPGDTPARWENLMQLARVGVQNCNHCTTGRREEVPIGTRCQNLEVTGPCRSAQHDSGSSKREIQCRCVLCGREDWWQKTNFLAGKANCNCHRETMGGQSNTVKGRIFSHARRRAEERGLPFTITLEDVAIPAVCPVLGIPLQANQGYFRENSPSLDKIIPEQGYTPENCWVISWRANRLKGDGSLAELRALVTALETRLEQ